MFQASNAKVCISVIADGQEHPVKLSNAIHDSVAPKSLITKSKATASQGLVRSTAPTTVSDHSGATYTSKSTITLRWYYEDGTQTFPETFYIVESATKELPWDAILCKKAEAPSTALVPQANTILKGHQGVDKQRENQRKTREAANQEKYEKEKRKQAETIKKAFELKHAVTKHG